MVTYEYRELMSSHRLIISTAAYGPYSSEKKKKNLKTVWVTPTHLAEERSLWKQVEDAGLPSHQILHTREGMWNPEHLLKGLELHIRYLQILRTVPEAWAPQTSSFKNQQSLRPQDPPGYKDLRNHAERAWALGLTCCRVQGGSSKSSDRGTLWERFIDWSWILSLMGSRLTWKMFGGLYSPWDENCKGPFFFALFFFPGERHPHLPLCLAAACGFCQAKALLVSWFLQLGPRGYLWLSGSGGPWDLNWGPHKTVYICIFSKLLPGGLWLPVCLNLGAA